MFGKLLNFIQMVTYHCL